MKANDLEMFFLKKDKKNKSKKINVINPSLIFEQSRETKLKQDEKEKRKVQLEEESMKPPIKNK